MANRICSFPDCGRPVHSRDLCNGHRQQLNAGRSLVPLRCDVTPEERFWRLVRVAPGQCWEWAGTKSRAGYGYFKKPGRRHIYAHRFSWELANGPIPDGLIVCHRCDNPPCVNPDHLFLGTYLDNAQDRDRKGRGQYPGALNPPRRESHYAAKLSGEDVVEIRHSWAQPHGPRSGLGRRLAAQYGVSPQLISSIVNNQRWKA